MHQESEQTKYAARNGVHIHNHVHMHRMIKNHAHIKIFGKNTGNTYIHKIFSSGTPKWLICPIIVATPTHNV